MDYSNVACITGDNANHSFAEKDVSYFVGCASHCLNLGIKIILESYSGVTKCIHELMTLLQHLKARAARCRHKHLGPALCNVTCCSSIKKLIDRYLKILQPISIVAHLDLQLPPGKNQLASNLQKILSDLDLLTVAFQNEDLSLCIVRDYLDAAIKAFPKLS
jgi:hypothetical protein